jgi:hypothetical protein
MRKAARRFASPIDTMRRAKLEPIHQPLYSCYIFDNAVVPSSALFFGYGVGGQVATNQATPPGATELHTNMVTPNFLPSPKMFLVTGVRVIPVEIDAIFQAGLDSTGGNTFVGPTFTSGQVWLLEDLVKLVYGSVFKFFVGTKNYLTNPTWNVPANSGIQGESDMIYGGGSTPIAASMTQRLATFHSAGRYFALPAFPTMIVPQQNFNATMEFPQVSRPILGADRAVYTVLDGILGREVQ